MRVHRVVLLILLAVPAFAQPPLTREALEQMYASRDRFCGTGDPWFMFFMREKTPAERAMLKAWAKETGSEVALLTVATLRDADLVPFWRERVQGHPAGSSARSQALRALLTAGGAPLIDEVYGHLGESEDLDRSLLFAASEPPYAAAVPHLRAYQRTKKASPVFQQELTRTLLRLDPKNAGGDEEELLQRADSNDVYAVLENTDRSVPRLEKLLALLGKVSGRDHEEVSDRIAFDLFNLLEQGDAKAVKLAETWSKPPPTTEKLLAHSPSVHLVLALFAQSRGDLRTAEAVFTRGLAIKLPPPEPMQSISMSSPEVGYAALRLHAACFLESTGRRTQALGQLEALEPTLKPLNHDLHNLIDNLGFNAYSPYWCYRGTSAASLATMPLVLTATRTPTRRGFSITTRVTNASSRPVTVRGCTAGSGVLPARSLSVHVGEQGLFEGPALDCSKGPRTLEPGEVLEATFEVKARGQRSKGVMRLSLEAAIEPKPKDSSLWFLFDESAK